MFAHLRAIETLIVDSSINDLLVATDIYHSNVTQITKCWHMKRAIAAHELNLTVKYRLLFSVSSNKVIVLSLDLADTFITLY